MIDKLLMKKEFDSIQYNAESGLSLERLKEKCALLSEQEDHFKAKVEIEKLLLENSQIPIKNNLPFTHFINIGGISREIREKWKNELVKEDNDSWKFGRDTLAYDCKFDFGHLSFDWQDILELGIPGLLERVKRYQENQEDNSLYRGCITILEAIGNYLSRLANSTNNEQLKSCLDNLRINKPQTMYEAMELIIVFYFVETRIDTSTIRSIGLLDRLLYPFYKKDLESGKYSKEQLDTYLEEFLYYFYLWNILNNIPFGLAGINQEGNDITNELTYRILEIYDKLDIISPKIHIMVNDNTPIELIEKCLDMIRRGHNSILFANQDIIIKAYEKMGINEKDARNHLLVGCYEPTIIGKEIPCTCAGRINILKAVEYSLTKGKDVLANKSFSNIFIKPMDTFGDFLEGVKAYLKDFSDSVMDNLRYYESLFPLVNPTPLLSCCFENCLKTNKEAFGGGVEYNNTSINAIGLASAVDSLYTIQKLVYQEKRYSIDELSIIIQNNWIGYDKLRKEIDNYPKYGNNNDQVDNIAKLLVEYLGSLINGKKNGRNGTFRLGMFSIDWRMELGEKSAASIDGRKAGNPLSKNIGAMTAKDRNGVTAHILSTTKLDYSLIPNGTVLDVVLHPTSISGENGLIAFRSLLNVFFNRGGMTIHFNVIDSETLKKAQKEPDKYSTLQIRLCGWNVYFVELSKLEQDEFIAQSELNA